MSNRLYLWLAAGVVSAATVIAMLTYTKHNQLARKRLLNSAVRRLPMHRGHLLSVLERQNMTDDDLLAQQPEEIMEMFTKLSVTEATTRDFLLYFYQEVANAERWSGRPWAKALQSLIHHDREPHRVFLLVPFFIDNDDMFSGATLSVDEQRLLHKRASGSYSALLSVVLRSPYIVTATDHHCPFTLTESSTTEDLHSFTKDSTICLAQQMIPASLSFLEDIRGVSAEHLYTLMVENKLDIISVRDLHLHHNPILDEDLPDVIKLVEGLVKLTRVDSGLTIRMDNTRIHRDTSTIRKLLRIEAVAYVTIFQAPMASIDSSDFFNALASEDPDTFKKLIWIPQVWLHGKGWRALLKDEFIDDVGKNHAEFFKKDKISFCTWK